MVRLQKKIVCADVLLSVQRLSSCYTRHSADLPQLNVQASLLRAAREMQTE